MKVYKSLHSFKGDSKFSTWLYRIAYNATISHTRKKKQEFMPLGDQLIENFTENEIVNKLDHLERELQHQMVLEIIDQLSMDERALVSLFYIENYRIEDICQISELSNSNVKVKLFRIRKTLHIA